MIRRNLLMRLCGAGLLVLLGPVTLQAQTATTGGGTATTGATATTTTTGSSGINGGASSTGSVGAAPALTTATTIYSATSGAGSTTTIPSNSNVFGNTMVNPYSLGSPANYVNQFGAQNTISSGGGPKGSFTYLFTAPPATASGSASTVPTTANGFTTYGIQRAPVYSTVLSPSMPMPKYATSKLQTDLRAAISRSSQLKNKDSINVNVQGDVVTLTGTVANGDERSIVEGMVRMTPGVLDVRNELAVPDSKK